MLTLNFAAKASTRVLLTLLLPLDSTLKQEQQLYFHQHTYTRKHKRDLLGQNSNFCKRTLGDRKEFFVTGKKKTLRWERGVGLGRYWGRFRMIGVGLRDHFSSSFPFVEWIQDFR